MALTQMPCFAHSIASDFVSMATAALLAQYAATSNSATNDEIEPMLMMRPYLRSIMWRPKTWHARKVPLRLISMMLFHSVSETSSVGVRLVVPAQLTRISTEWNSAMVAARRDSMLARFVTSHATARDLPPADLMSPAADCASSARRPVGTTLAPALARPFASARPMPEVPPMTTAVLLARSSGA